MNRYGARSTQQKYRVRSGDSLSKISKDIYADARLWTEIAWRNHLRPPYMIQVGQVLDIPPLFVNSMDRLSVGKTDAAPSAARQTLLPKQSVPYFPLAEPPCDVKVELSSEAVKSLLGDFAPSTAVIQGNCYTITPSVEGSITMARAKGASCLTLSHESLSASLSSEQAVNEYLKVISDMELEFNVVEQTLSLKSKIGSSFQLGKTKFEYGLGGGNRVATKMMDRSKSGGLSVSPYVTYSTEFDHKGVRYELNLSIKLTFTLDLTKCIPPLGDIVVFQRIRQRVPVISHEILRTSVKVLVVGGVVVLAGVALAYAGTIASMALAPALLLMLIGHVWLEGSKGAIPSLRTL